MLARKYDEYAWELEEQQENTVRQTAYVKRPKQRNLKLMRRRIAVVAGILLATFCMRCTQRMPYFQKQ